MPSAIDYEDDQGLIRFLEINSLNEKIRNRARKRFLDYQHKGVVINGSYEDGVWELNNELETVRLRFSYDPILYSRYAEPWLGFGLDEYTEFSKAYAALCLGDVTLSTLRDTVKGMRILVKTPYDELPSLLPPSSINVFLTLLPEGNPRTEELLELLEARAASKRRRKHQRQLLPFQNYIRFNSAVIDFWGEADDEEKLQYFPVYLWWTLTTILPLRPTEFLLTPRNCLCRKDGAEMMSVRRTRLKKRPQEISYSLSGDYELHSYEIPEWMATEIRWYLENTEGGRLADAGLLFVPEGPRSRNFSYDSMRHRLADFCDAAGYIGDTIHLGDTRHLAMINLILSGGSPSVCRELAWHEDIDVSSNYYANLSEVVKEAVYDYSHRNGKGALLSGRQFYPVTLPDKKTRVENGWCSCAEVSRGGIGPCIGTFSAEVGIGDCRRCTWFYPDDPGVRLELEYERQKAVDEDGAFLMQMIELVRRGKGSEESIRAALSRLQNTSHDYGTLLYRRYQEENRDGKDWET